MVRFLGWLVVGLFVAAAVAVLLLAALFIVTAH